MYYIWLELSSNKNLFVNSSVCGVENIDKISFFFFFFLTWYSKNGDIMLLRTEKGKKKGSVWLNEIIYLFIYYFLVSDLFSFRGRFNRIEQ